MAKALLRRLVAISLLWSGAASAQGADSRLELVVFPSLGPHAAVADGWFSCVVQLANPSDVALSGTVELVNERTWNRDAPRNVSEAPFRLPPRGRVALELPARGFYGVPPSLVARALDDGGRLLREQALPDLHPHQPLLFDLDVPSRIAPALRGLAVPAAASRSQADFGAPVLAVSSPQISAWTGDAILPVRAAGYASVTVLLARSETLAKVNGAELEALASWTLAGGALAVVVTRPEDLRGPLLEALAGGHIKRGPAPAALAAATPGAAPSDLIAPPPHIANQLAGYSGGNLRESRWGASASYGLGELHLLAFDATREPFTIDEWVRHKLVELVAHAWQRRVVIALPHAQTALDVPELERIRRELDPNEGTRWMIGIAVVLLLIYVLGVGQNLYHSLKQRRALRSPWFVPVWAIVAFILVVALRFAGKGAFGSVRRLTLVEAGAGMPRAAATRFRGFYAGSAGAQTVESHDRNSVLDVAGDDEGGERRLYVDRDGARLESFRAEPWQTLVVREDGFIALEGGVTLAPRPGGDVAITNRLARDLLGVVVKAPDKEAVLLRRLRDGQTVLASQGEKLTLSSIGVQATGALGLHKLRAETFAEELEQAASGLGDSWRALEALAPGVDWWPDDVPVLIAQIDGGEGQSVDSGVSIDLDRVLIRVIGWGGAG